MKYYRKGQILTFRCWVMLLFWPCLLSSIYVELTQTSIYNSTEVQPQGLIYPTSAYSLSFRFETFYCYILVITFVTVHLFATKGLGNRLSLCDPSPILVALTYICYLYINCKWFPIHAELLKWDTWKLLWMLRSNCCCNIKIDHTFQ